MPDSRWSEIDALFNRALNVEEDERERWVRAEAGDDAELATAVIALLGEVDSSGQRIEALVDARDDLILNSIDDESKLSDDGLIGQQLGDFEIRRLVARGGMGAVYEAQRIDGQFRQRVAIKILPAWSADPATVSRLRAERQILSNLSYPHITRVIDGGETPDGTPYLVTEFIDGVPITDAANALDLRGKLTLFCRVADSVHYAHRNLVIHRDIKPSNILVDAEGHPHLLDFGIAKLVQPEAVDVTVMPTHKGFSPMTLAYASPEQLKGENVTTASDVYQLGLLLYRLLTGSLPDRGDQLADGTLASPSSMIRTGRSSDTSLPASAIKGELDTIVLKALRPEPHLRYGSAAELAQDVRRHLAGEAILARPESTIETLRRVSRRSPVATGIAAFALLAVFGWLASLVIYSNQLEQQRDAAQRQAERAESVKNVLRDLYRRQDPLQGDSVAASPGNLRAAIDSAVIDTEANLADEPDIQGELYEIFSELYRGLGEQTESLELARRSIEAWRLAGPDALAERLLAEAQYAGVLMDTDRDKALAIFQRVSDEFVGIEETNPKAAVTTLIAIGFSKLAMGSVADALVDIERANTVFERSGIDDSSLQIELWFGLARAYVEQSRLEEAESLLMKALTLGEAEFGPDHSRLTGVLNALAALERNRGNAGRAIALSERVIAIMERDRAANYENLLNARNNLAIALAKAERYEEAAMILADVAMMHRADASDTGSARLSTTLKNYATMLHLAGDYEAALVAVKEAEVMMRSHIPESSPYRATPYFTMALIYLDTGMLPEAKTAVTVAEDLLIATLGESHYQVAVTRCIHAEIVRQQGDLEAAATLVDASYERIADAGNRAEYYATRCRSTRDKLIN